MHASILTRAPFVFGVDTSVNAETVNHWAKVTAVTLPIHAITEIAELSLEICGPLTVNFANHVFFFYLSHYCIILRLAITLPQHQDYHYSK